MNGVLSTPALRTHLNRFSIVVPTRGRVEQLRGCLDALCALDYPAEKFEVIVVDDGSDMPLEALRHDFGRRLRLTLAAQRHLGPAAARNAGARLAKFEILAFTDDDCRPAPDWLAVIAACFASQAAGAVAGRVVNAQPDNWYAEASTTLVDFIARFYNADGAPARFATSNNFAVPAEPFASLDGFDPRFTLAAGEDRDFCDRWRQDGRHICWCPDAVVRHHQALDLRGFLRQQFNYGRGAYRYRRGRAERLRVPLSLERPSFYVDLLRSPASRGPTVISAGLTVLLGVAQVATLAGFFVESILFSRGAVRAPR